MLDAASAMDLCRTALISAVVIAAPPASTGFIAAVLIAYRPRGAQAIAKM